VGIHSTSSNDDLRSQSTAVAPDLDQRPETQSPNMVRSRGKSYPQRGPQIARG